MAGLGRLLDRIYVLAAWMAGGLLILMTGLILFSILSRVIGTYSGGATDVAGYVMATSTFLALSYTFRSHGHIRVTLLLNRFKGTTHRAMTLFCLGFMALLTSYFAFYMARLAYDSHRFGERSQGADAILLWIPQTPVAAGAALFALATVHTFVEVLLRPDAFEETGAQGPSEV
ncbi:MAG: TRAP transporter small permease subunit [Alphaproteobacteria bacterium]|nr:TRAP transporter small permease subunit [Alphaproteobacteria bacterium]